MTNYQLPAIREKISAPANVVYTVASGDLRLAANVTCWPTQEKVEPGSKLGS